MTHGPLSLRGWLVHHGPPTMRMSGALRPTKKSKQSLHSANQRFPPYSDQPSLYLSHICFLSFSAAGYNICDLGARRLSLLGMEFYGLPGRKRWGNGKAYTWRSPPYLKSCRSEMEIQSSLNQWMKFFIGQNPKERTV